MWARRRICVIASPLTSTIRQKIRRQRDWSAEIRQLEYFVVSSEGGGFGLGKQPDQDPPAEVQHITQGRQVLPSHCHHERAVSTHLCHKKGGQGDYYGPTQCGDSAYGDRLNSSSPSATFVSLRFDLRWCRSDGWIFACNTISKSLAVPAKGWSRRRNCAHAVQLARRILKER